MYGVVVNHSFIQCVLNTNTQCGEAYLHISQINSLIHLLSKAEMVVDFIRLAYIDKGVKITENKDRNLGKREKRDIGWYQYEVKGKFFLL